MKNLQSIILGAALYIGAAGLNGCTAAAQQRVDSFDQNYGAQITEMMQRNPDECRRVAIKYAKTAVNTGTITPEQLYGLLTAKEQNAVARRWALSRTTKELDDVLGGAYSSARELNQKAALDGPVMSTRMPDLEEGQDEAYKKAKEIVESYLQQNQTKN